MHREPQDCSLKEGTRTKARHLALIAAIAIVFTLPACGNLRATTSHNKDTNPPTHSQSAQQSFLADAQADPAVSAQQIDILEQPEILFADYETAMERAFTCMESANVKVNRNGTIMREGVTVLDYTFETSTTNGSADQIYTDCHTEHAEYVDSYWQTSTPEGIAFSVRRAEALAPAMRTCLENLGEDVAPDASFRDMDFLASGFIVKMAETDDPSYDCYETIGYNTWNG